jgi:hypothetical protein
MNIFALGLFPEDAAADTGDKHVVKMIVESAQLLCCAKSHCDFGGQQVPLEALAWLVSDLEKTYKNAHKNHPCAVAVRRCRKAFTWVAELALALCAEYTLRYGKTHATEPLLMALASASIDNPTGEPFSPKTVVGTLPTRRGPIQLPLCVTSECVCYNAAGEPDVIQSYRRYYILVKAAILSWKKRKPPRWFRRGLAAHMKEVSSIN